MIKSPEWMRRNAAALRARAKRARDLDSEAHGELLRLAVEWEKLAAEVEAERVTLRS